MGPAADESVFESATSGVRIRKLEGWRFAAGVEVLANRAVARLKDKELEDEVQRRANLPLVVIQKHAETQEDVNRTVQLMVRPLGPLQGRSAVERMQLVVPTLERAMAAFRIVEPIRDVLLGGMPAATLRAAYGIANPDGRTFHLMTRAWIAPWGSYMFMISASGPADGLDVSEREFAEIVGSIRIEI
jgi:hypothetical protein